MTPDDAVKTRILDEMIEASRSRESELQKAADYEKHYRDDLQQRREALGRATSVNGRHHEPIRADLASKPIQSQCSIAELVEEVLSASDGPMKLTDISQGVADMGGQSKSSKGLTAIISSVFFKRKDKYIRIGTATYDLKDRHQHHEKTTGGG